MGYGWEAQAAMPRRAREWGMIDEKGALCPGTRKNGGIARKNKPSCPSEKNRESERRYVC